jgi:hypothetical protein
MNAELNTAEISPRASTIRSVLAAMTDGVLFEQVPTWPPDVFALVDRVLDATETYRFVVSPPPGVELEPSVEVAGSMAKQWWEVLDGPARALPEAIAGPWRIVRDALDIEVEALAAGDAWPVIQALLLLYAIADESCAGLGSSAAVAAGPGSLFRARARELFAESGSLSTFPTGLLRVVPRCRTSVGGISIRSLSRHVCVRGPQVDVEWHRMLGRPTGVAVPESHANVVLFPWPLQVRARNFQRVDYTLPQMDPNHTGFFWFEPNEPLDLERVDAVLRAAIDEAGTVDVVVFPECAILQSEIEPLEELLERHGVWCLFTGVREPPGVDGPLGGNWVHVGIRQATVWRHAVQNKHHRWRLDGRQIGQYHLGGALNPDINWWEAISVPRRSLQIIDVGSVTFATLVCEDLARLEPVADLVRSIGPSLVITLLLDGPQLGSRWTARYASVLADDPGSAVCTLTSYGMVHRSRPGGRQPSRVVGLWKDPSGELTEISLADGADAVLIAPHVAIGACRTADGRTHPGTTRTLSLAGVQSLFADAAPPKVDHRIRPPDPTNMSQALRALDEREVSKATSWAEAIAEAIVVGPETVSAIIAEANATAWREPFGLPRPSRLFVSAIDALRNELNERPTIEDLLAAATRMRQATDPAAVMTGVIVGIAVEQRLIAEVAAGRLAPDTLSLLTGDLHAF